MSSPNGKVVPAGHGTMIIVVVQFTYNVNLYVSMYDLK